jgi:cell division protein FtsB
LLREIKNRLRGLLPALLFSCITWYFAWNVMHGTHGLEAQRRQETQLLKARLAFSTIDAERTLWERKVATLNGQSIAGDVLDNEARVVLNLANPGELIVELPATNGANK